MKKTLILFREGLSGHYLKAIINDSKKQIGFRVDPWHPGIYDDLDFDHLQRSGSLGQCACLHPHLIDTEQYMSLYDVTLTIQVHKKIYNACYNIFHKKYLVENIEARKSFDRWQDNLSYWYDLTYYNIKEYRALYEQDLQTNKICNVVNFDRILETEYIADVLDRYFNLAMTDNRKRIIADYRSQQITYSLNKDEQDMGTIVQALPDKVFQQSPWFASYCIFCFEHNNHLSESQRLWSVDHICTPIDRQFLLDLPNQYAWS